MPVRLAGDQGGHAAKAPAVIVQLEGMQFGEDVLALSAAGWSVNERSETGIRVVQWEGGTNPSVYTNLVRELPVLQLTDGELGRILLVAGRDPGPDSEFHVRLRADGQPDLQVTVENGNATPSPGPARRPANFPPIGFRRTR